MGQKSSIKQLPEWAQIKLNDLLRADKLTQSDMVQVLNTVLEEHGEDQRISKSSLNRYKVQMDQYGQRMKEAREISAMWIDRFGSSQGQVGNMVNEILRTLSFDLTMTVQQGGIDADNAPEVVEMLKGLSLTMQRLEKAASLNTAREKEIRDEAMKEAASRVDATAKRAGVSAEAIAKIHEELGISV